MEERRLGDNAVTEGWAFLFEHLIDDPAWLTRRLDFPRPREFAAEARREAPLGRPPLLREAALRARALQAPTIRCRCKQRYVELLGDALKIEPSPTDWLPTSTRAST